MRSLILVLLISLLLLAGCTGLFFLEETPAVVETPLVAETLLPPVEVTPVPSPSPSAPGMLTLRVWVPPQFDPNSGTPAGNLLRARLAEFSLRRPQVRIEVRIKAVEGPGSLLDSLGAASAAAPLALPDLVALPNSQLETAALKGLLHPYNNLSTALDSPDWYEYARQLARLQTSTFGMPFAGDALILVYRPAMVPEPPRDWAAALEAGGPIVFPAADTRALFTLALYQANGGRIRDDQGRPYLDAAALTEVLAFYQAAGQAEVMPYWLTQYQSDDQAWETLVENRTHMVITWASRYLGGLLADTAMTPIPTEDGAAFTLASGWVWALASPEPEQHPISVELAEFLTEPTFLAKWTEAAGVLPPRPSALSAWNDSALQSALGEVALSAQLYPSADVLTSLGPAVEQATLQVLKQQGDPSAAAQAAVGGVGGVAGP